MFDWFNNWREKRKLKAQQTRAAKRVVRARRLVYKLMEQPASAIEPTYANGFMPKQYWTKGWFFDELMIRRARFIRADLIEVLRRDRVIASWVDQDYQHGLGINDFACDVDFPEIIEHYRPINIGR